jgi:hypothetical protein
MNITMTLTTYPKVYLLNEHIKDPKYKTEMCKNWEKSSSCPYRNKCRFAHGKEELMSKENEQNPNYKQKDCLGFFKYGSCSYGRRCCFRHDERRVNETITSRIDVNILLRLRNPAEERRRLAVFTGIEEEDVMTRYRKPNTLGSLTSICSSSTRNSLETRILCENKKKSKRNQGKGRDFYEEEKIFVDLSRNVSSYMI